MRVSVPQTVPLHVIVIDPVRNDPGVELKIWHVTSWQGEVRNVALVEHDQIAFFDLDHLAEMRLTHSVLPPILHLA